MLGECMREAGSLTDALLTHAATWSAVRSEVCNGASVHVIDAFLPAGVAAHWHSTLNTSWAHASPCRENGLCEEASGGACAWLYTTNSHGGNQKVRSVHRRDERREFVKQMYARGGFAYSKWELAASHPLYSAMGEMMASVEVRTAVARVIGLAPGASDEDPPVGNISDYFVTAYASGDFLSTHSDGASGSLAWVLHLAGSGGWDSASGGALRFNGCGPTHGARDFMPAHNRLLLFHTRPGFVPHQVLPVGRVDEPRFGATGWWMTRGDHFSAATLKENEAMKAAASKAAMGDMCL